MTKPESPKKLHRVLQKAHPGGPFHHQRPLQGGNKGRNERQVAHWFFSAVGLDVEEFEVMEVLKKSNEICDLPDPLGSVRVRSQTVDKKYLGHRRIHGRKRGMSA